MTETVELTQETSSTGVALATNEIVDPMVQRAIEIAQDMAVKPPMTLAQAEKRYR